MRQELFSEHVESFMNAFGQTMKKPAQVYFSGGVSAVLYGWRKTTVDLDIKVLPDSEALTAISRLKNELHMNIELASPDDFIPAVPGWQSRSVFIKRVGQVDFFHFDFYSQALSKIERGFERDTSDVQAMANRRLIQSAELLRLFGMIKPELIRFPAIDPASFEQSVESFVLIADC